VLKSDRTHWGSLAKFFHWTIVLLIIVQGTIGLVMVDLPKRPSTIPVYSLHKSLGLTILALAVLRLAWRAFDPRPAEPAGMPRWQALGARLGHALLYALIFAVTLTGWRFDSVSGLRPLYWFGLFEVPHLGAPDPAGKEAAAEWHEAMFWTLVVVALGHAAMALIHQFVHHDNVLGRMWPDWLTRKPKPPMETPDAAPIPAPVVDPAAADEQRP
jgi:cytochrome b561